mmetsp:Transcript_87814/g.209853  ORF Transcript_87814/g.209853 Transcript_87814/m.209853 type:complete len:216 (-) Transcript_87814:771-1418(-)
MPILKAGDSSPDVDGHATDRALRTLKVRDHLCRFQIPQPDGPSPQAAASPLLGPIYRQAVHAAAGVKYPKAAEGLEAPMLHHPIGASRECLLGGPVDFQAARLFTMSHDAFDARAADIPELHATVEGRAKKTHRLPVGGHGQHCRGNLRSQLPHLLGIRWIPQPHAFARTGNDVPQLRALRGTDDVQHHGARLHEPVLQRGGVGKHLAQPKELDG